MTDAPAPTPPVANASRRVPRWVWFVVTCVALGVMTSVGVAWGIAWRVPQYSLPLLPLQSGVIEAARLDLRDETGKTVVPHASGWRVSKIEGQGLDAREFFVDGGNYSNDKLRSDFVGLASDRVCRVALARHTRLARTRDANFVRFRILSFGWPLRSLAYEEACTAVSASARKALLISPSFVNYPRDPVSVLTPATSPYSVLDVDPAFDLAPEYHAIHFKWRLLPTFPLWPGLLANTAIYGGAWAVLIGGPILLRRWLRARRGGCPQCGYSREGLKIDAPCPECGRATPAAHDATPNPTAR